MRQLNIRAAGACLAQLLLLVLMYGDYSPALWVIHKVLLLVVTLLLLVLTYQAFTQNRPVLALATALAAFPGLAFVLFFLMMLGKQ